MKQKLMMVLAACSLGACAQAQLPDIQIMDTQVFSESITSMADGTVFAGSVKGIVYRAEPGSAQAHEWIHHSPENGILTILGVLADEASNTLWLCSAPNFFGPERSKGTTSLMAFDLKTAAQKGVYPFPAPGGACNDVTIAKDGTAFASDTSNGRILKLAPGASALTVYGEDALLRGIDGLAFSADGTLYVNNVQTSQLIRVDPGASGLMGKLTTLKVSRELHGPDGMRLIDGRRFIQAESGTARLSIVDIEGDNASITVLRDDLKSSPGATVVGNTAYVIESNISYLLDPKLKGQEPEAFMLYAVPLP